MATAQNDKVKLVHVANRLSQKLDDGGWRLRKSATIREPFWRAWYVEFTGLPNMPVLGLYLGDYFSTGSSNLWVGFQSTSHEKIIDLQRVYETTKLAVRVEEYQLSQKNVRDILRKIGTQKPPVVREKGTDGWSYFGFYEYNRRTSEILFVNRALEFIELLIDAWNDKRPASSRDNDKRVPRQITERRGQPEFRNRLMTAYRNRCAISGCRTKELLEAAHIKSHASKGSYKVQNGILLRSDLHTLLDLKLLRIDPATRRITIDKSVGDDEYRQYHGMYASSPRTAQY